MGVGSGPALCVEGWAGMIVLSSSAGICIRLNRSTDHGVEGLAIQPPAPSPSRGTPPPPPARNPSNTPAPLPSNPQKSLKIVFRTSGE